MPKRKQKGFKVSGAGKADELARIDARLERLQKRREMVELRAQYRAAREALKAKHND
jgi:hypothetical protein